MLVPSIEGVGVADAMIKALRILTLSEFSTRVSDDPGKPGLRTATMHRVKGLEFDAMIIAGSTMVLCR